jgi:hypothetical protein
MRSYASYSDLTVSGLTQMLLGVTPVPVMWVPAWKTVVENCGNLKHLIGTSEVSRGSRTMHGTRRQNHILSRVTQRSRNALADLMAVQGHKVAAPAPLRGCMSREAGIGWIAMKWMGINRGHHHR